MSPEEKEEFIAALQGKDMILLRFKKKPEIGCNPKDLIEEKSEWMTIEEVKYNSNYNPKYKSHCYAESWFIYSRHGAKICGYI